MRAVDLSDLCLEHFNILFFVVKKVVAAHCMLHDLLRCSAHTATAPTYPYVVACRTRACRRLRCLILLALEAYMPVSSPVQLSSSSWASICPVSNQQRKQREEIKNDPVTVLKYIYFFN